MTRFLQVTWTLLLNSIFNFSLRIDIRLFNDSSKKIRKFTILCALITYPQLISLWTALKIGNIAQTWSWGPLCSEHLSDLTHEIRLRNRWWGSCCRICASAIDCFFFFFFASSRRTLYVCFLECRMFWKKTLIYCTYVYFWSLCRLVLLWCFVSC